ncbi:hypothetical protein DV736_g3606, partial [Chaetothyriales sp. CBS 134916]
MARTGGKRQLKAASVPTKQKTAGSDKNPSTVQASIAPLGSALPEPFTPAAPSLYPFLSTLPHDHVFLTHLDRTPTDLKRYVFLVPCLLNLLIILGLCVRIYYAIPTYVQQISAIFGYDSPYKVNVAQESTTSLIGTVFERTFLLFADYALFSLLGSWPREFLFGSVRSRFAGPVEWRWTLGFRDVEVIVRRGRKWDGPLFVQPRSEDDQQQQQTQLSSQTSARSTASSKSKSSGKERTTPWNSDEIGTLKFKSSPAMAPSKLSKTGYLLLDKDYDLDFRAILDAHRLAIVTESSPSTSEERPRLDLNDIDGCVFVYYDDPKVERFKQALVDLKCRDVFYRWIEIVQFETIDEQQRRKALTELKTLLEAKGVALDTLFDDIGGVQGLPGL